MGMSCWSDPSYKDAFRLAVAGCFLEFIFTFAGIAGYIWYGSALCLVYGLENLVDFLSSAVVLWRFYAPGSLTKEREQVLKAREARAGVAISFIIILMGISVLAAAIGEMKHGGTEESTEDSGLHILVTIAFLSIFIFSIMTMLKLQYAAKLESESLRKDGLCSLIGVALSMMIFINSLIVKSQAQDADTLQEEQELWVYDALFAILCGILALIIGFHGIYVAKVKDGLPIFSGTWWKGTDMKEIEVTTTTISMEEKDTPETTNLSSEVV